MAAKSDDNGLSQISIVQTSLGKHFDCQYTTNYTIEWTPVLCDVDNQTSIRRYIKDLELRCPHLHGS